MLHYKIYMNSTITPKIYINIFMTHFIVPPKARCVDQRLNDEVSEMTIFKVSKWLIHVHWTFSSRVNAGRRNKTAQNEHKLQGTEFHVKRPITIKTEVLLDVVVNEETAHQLFEGRYYQGDLSS